MGQIIGNWAKGNSTTVAADKISVVLSDPGPGLKRVVKNVHLSVDPTDVGAGIVTYRVIRGATATPWFGVFVTGQGCWWDCTGVLEGNVGETLTLEVERAGLVTGLISYEVAAMQAAP